jgi:transposase-like protein
MGLSRRVFTEEFKLAAVRRLEQGVSMGEVARALEVSANVLWKMLGKPVPSRAAH